MASSEEQDRPHFTFIWTLETVTKQTCLDLTSPSFLADTIDKGEWSLVLWERRGKLLCRPCRNRNDLESFEIVYETAIITSNGSIMNKKREKRFFEPKFVYNLKDLSGIGENVLLEEKDRSKFEGILTIRFRMWKPGCKSGKTSFCFAHTRLRQEQRYFTWSIPKFSSLLTGQRRSFHLQVTPRGDLLHVLDLYLQCNDKEKKICIEKPKTCPYRIYCKVSVVSAAGNIVCSKSISGGATFIRMSKLMSNTNLFLPNDVLYLRCEYEIDFGVVSNRIESYEQSSMATSKHIIDTTAMDDDCTVKRTCCPCCCPLQKAVKKYYENGELTDINLQAGSELFPAHKIILSAKAQMFEKMFTKDKSKKGRKTIELTGFEPDILRALLLYMYTDKVENITIGNAMKLYEVAINCQLQDLREQCSKYLESNLCMANIFTVVDFAEKQQDGRLRNAARMFIFEHDNEIFDSDDWKNFKKKNSNIAMDVMQYFCYLRRVACDAFSQIVRQSAD